MSQNLAQLRRIVFRKFDATSKDPTVSLVVDPDDLGQDTILTFNIAPRMAERASSLGTTSTPIPGTFDALSASITMLADNWSTIGKALGMWNKASFEGATAADGNIVGGKGDNLCGTSDYVNVIIQGVCDDGSATDIEFARCYPALSDDVELGGSDTTEVTVNLNPIAYNPNTHANDGYPEYTYRLGDNSLTEKQRLNVTTGKYDAVTAVPGA